MVEIDETSTDDDVVGKLVVSLKMQEIFAAVALAYRHSPGYAEATAALRANSPQVQLGLSEAARNDELADRRLKRQSDE